MKIIKNGKVYDLNCGKYDRICPIAEDSVAVNEVGNTVLIERELRKDLTSGLFYIVEIGNYCYGYRTRINLVPLSEDEAKIIAEDRIDYDEYVIHFGKVEGDNEDPMEGELG